VITRCPRKALPRVALSFGSGDEQTGTTWRWPRREAKLGNLRSDVLKIVGALAVGKAVVITTAFLTSGANFLYDMSTRWDSAWFLGIAEAGYNNPNVIVHSPDAAVTLSPNAYAFSPFFPALIRGLTLLTGTDWVSALMIVNALSFVVPYVIYRTFGLRVALLAELFPVYLVYTTIAYSESLVLLCVSLSIFLAVRRRVFASSGSLSLVILSAYSLAVTLPSFALAFLERYRWRTALFFVLPALTGLLILIWLQFASGSYMIFFTIESTHWQVSFATPYQQVIWLLQKGNDSLGFWPFPGGWLTRNLPFEVFYVFGALYLIRLESENHMFLAVYSFSVVLPLFFVIGGPVLSIPRLLLPAFPVFITYASLIRGRYAWLYGVACLSLAVWVTMSQMLFFFA
jgi:hypothetical protein